MQLVSLALTWASYIFTLVLIRQERNYLLPSSPPRGHGAVLLIFFALIFVAENLSFINYRHEDWWFHFRKYVYVQIRDPIDPRGIKY